ncbi:unnamed protein product [Dimorphilus gyrociliatus]|uniref:Uncharacterized protein n=1 Tax=Dimorphilus gyrociliatus TaxID=2664684 RepID=A0A7I8VZP2_9ANNE|nr:unnamed protein product [Dimorphilus gyrociliatus]
MTSFKEDVPSFFVRSEDLVCCCRHCQSTRTPRTAKILRCLPNSIDSPQPATQFPIYINRKVTRDTGVQTETEDETGIGSSVASMPDTAPKANKRTSLLRRLFRSKDASSHAESSFMDTTLGATTEDELSSSRYRKRSRFSFASNPTSKREKKNFEHKRQKSIVRRMRAIKRQLMGEPTNESYRIYPMALL